MKPCRHFQTGSGIGFFYEILPAPAGFPAAKQNQIETAQRKQDIAQDIIFKIKNGGEDVKKTEPKEITIKNDLITIEFNMNK